MKRVSIDSVTSGTSVRVGGAHRGGWQGAPRASVTSAQVAQPQVTIVTSYDSATTLQVIILSCDAIPRSYTHAKMAILPKRYKFNDPRLHQPNRAMSGEWKRGMEAGKASGIVETPTFDATATST